MPRLRFKIRELIAIICLVSIFCAYVRYVIEEYSTLGTGIPFGIKSPQDYLRRLRFAKAVEIALRTGGWILYGLVGLVGFHYLRKAAHREPMGKRH